VGGYGHIGGTIGGDHKQWLNVQIVTSHVQLAKFVGGELSVWEK
jgi:hypothetical protein